MSMLLLPAVTRCMTLTATCSCLPDGLPAPATPTHTTMLCMFVYAIDAAMETYLRTERPERTHSTDG